MKKWIVISMLAVSQYAVAEMDGAEILKQEAERAQEIQRLQHQAEMLKQRAEIAKYANQIRESGGDPGEFGVNGVAPAPAARIVASPKAESQSAKSKTDSVPKLVQIEKSRAAFDTSEGRVFGGVGQTLPGGFRIVSIDLTDGARLQKNGVLYDIDLAW